MCVRGGRREEGFCPECWFQIGACVSTCPHFINVGENAKLIISTFKDIWVEYEWKFLKVPINWEKSSSGFLVFIYFSFDFIRSLWRVCAYGQERCQKVVEKYKCLICCCTWNLVSIIYIVRFSTRLCPVSLIMKSVFVIFGRKREEKNKTRNSSDAGTVWTKMIIKS